MSWRLAPSTAKPTGMPWASVRRLRLTPPLPRSVGLGPVFPPAQGRLGHSPIHAHPTPVQPLQFVVTFQSHSPQFQEHSSGNPFLKAQVGGGPRADACGIQGFPLASGAQHVEDAIGAGAIGNPGPATAEPMGVHMLWDQGLQHFPELVRDLETASGRIGLCGWAIPLRTWRLAVSPFTHSPSLAPTPAILLSTPPHLSVSF